MRIYGRKNLKWLKNSLWEGDNYKLAIVEDSEHKGMFWLKWPDGVKSEDFYNKTRAVDHAIRLTLQDLNKTDQETGLGAS